eukprot:3725061-Pleurochrysis_carterae.AAC.5
MHAHAHSTLPLQAPAQACAHCTEYASHTFALTPRTDFYTETERWVELEPDAPLRTSSIAASPLASPPTLSLLGDHVFPKVSPCALKSVTYLVLALLAPQLDTDEQLAMALQEEFAFEDESRSRRGGSTPASGSRSAPNSGSKKSQGKLSNEAKQLLVKFGRYKSRNGTQRLLPTDGADSAAPDARDAYEPNFSDIGYDPPAPVPLVSTTRELEHRTEQMTLAEQDNLDEPTSSLPQARTPLFSAWPTRRHATPCALHNPSCQPARCTKSHQPVQLSPTSADRPRPRNARAGRFQYPSHLAAASDLDPKSFVT